MVQNQLSDSLKFASIDIGSNAMRLLFCRVLENSSTAFIKESLIRMPLRLGEDAFTLGKISDENTQKLKNTIHAFYLMIQAYDPISFKSCATSALRTASNGQVIVDEINKIVNVNLQIISGKEEARIIMANHIEQHLDPKKHYVYIDVGGGSTEISFIVNEKKHYLNHSNWFSANIKDQVSTSDWEKMQSWVIEQRNQFDGPTKSIGSGGNINKIFSMIEDKKKNEINIDTIREVLNTIKPLSLKQRIVELGLRPDRADVIMHAGKIYERIMDWSQCEKMIVPHSGFQMLFMNYTLSIFPRLRLCLYDKIVQNQLTFTNFKLLKLNL